MIKMCTACGLLFPVEDFPIRSASKDGHTSKCFTCTREYNRKDYAANRPTRIGRNNAHRATRRKRNKELVRNYLLEHPCVDCRESDIVVLEFDHVRGTKLNDISNMLGLSENSILSEIEKCEVRCANCHRRVTYNRRLEVVSG